MLKTTQWSPDTCGCIFEYEWDTDHSESTRTHALKRLVAACAAHVGTERQRFDAVLAENTVKNRGISRVAEVLAVEPDSVSWAIDQRTRDITITAAMTAPQRTSLATDLAAISPRLKVARL